MDVPETGKVLIVGETRLQIEADQLPVEFCDLVLESRHNMNVIYLSLGTGIMDAANTPSVRVVARLRMSLAMAQNVRDNLMRLVEDALKPPDKSQAN